MSKMRLKSNMAEHLAVGLLTVLIDMPYDIIGVKFLHWVWHDTDPNIGMYYILFLACMNFKHFVLPQPTDIIGFHGILIIFMHVLRPVFIISIMLPEAG